MAMTMAMGWLWQWPCAMPCHAIAMACHAMIMVVAMANHRVANLATVVVAMMHGCSNRDAWLCPGATFKNHP